MARPGLTKHRKFGRLARRLGSDVLALGHLEWLWMAAYESGSDYLGEADDVEAAAHWTGAPGALVDALLTCGGAGHAGFIEHRGGNGYYAHDLYDHAPGWAKARWYKRQYRARGLGDPARWVAIRVRILERDGWRCRYCGGPADTVDHVVPRVKGGTHDDDNLVAACRPCNGRKQDRSVAEAGLTPREAADA